MKLRSDATHIRNQRRLRPEELELRRLLTQVSFSEPIGIGAASEYRQFTTNDTWLVDLDTDGALDLVTQGQLFGDETLSWNLNDGNGDITFAGSLDLPSTTTRSAFADFDGDGDVDLLNFDTTNASWFENNLVDFGAFNRVSQTVSILSEVRGVGDFNIDGLADLLTSTGWARNLGNGEFQELSIPGFEEVIETFIIDIDDDGDLDLVNRTGAGLASLSVVENVGSEQVFASPSPKGPEFDASDREFIAFDADADGDIDLVTLPENDIGNSHLIYWAENVNGAFEFKLLREFTLSQGEGPYSLAFPFDASGDGQLDLVFKVGKEKFGWFDDLGSSAWNEVRLSEINSLDVFSTPEFEFADVGDVDGDGDLDWIGTAAGGGAASFDGFASDSDARVLFANNQADVSFVQPIDFDADGDIDGVFESHGHARWVENLGNGTFATVEVIARVEFPFSVRDLNGDDLPDLVSYSLFGSGVSWYPNLGSGNVGQRIKISDTGTVGLDFDGDGDLDLQNGQSVLLNDGSGKFEAGFEVPAGRLFPTDVNQDGDQDLMALLSGEVAWYENLGDNTYGPANVIANYDRFNSSFEWFVSDFDADGDADYVVSQVPELVGDKLSIVFEVFENRAGHFARVQENDFDFAIDDLNVADLDGDGDQDLIAETVNGATFIENLGGLRFDSPRDLNIGGRGRDLAAADVDGDGYVDLLNAYSLGRVEGRQLGWVRNETGDRVSSPEQIDRLFAAIRTGSDSDEYDRNGDGHVNDVDADILIRDVIGTRRGDSNLDGTVNFADFLTLSSKFGKQDARWSDGDFDGDGTVGFDDFLLLAAEFGYGEGSDG